MFLRSSNEYGFYLDTATSNTLTANMATSNIFDGFYLESSSSNTLTQNTASNNTAYGISLDSTSGNNTLYFNYLLDNQGGTAQALDDETSNSNAWTNGTHGNFYSDYSGLDSNADGIGESNYTLDGSANANDTRPLVILEPLVIPEFPVSTMILVLPILLIYIVILRKKR